MSFGSLRIRLIAGGAAFILAAVIVSAAGLAILFERHVVRWIDEQLSVHLNQLVAGVDLGPSGDLVVARPPTDPRFDRQLSGLYWQAIVEPSGPVLRSRSLWDYEITLPPEQGDSALKSQHQVKGPGDQSLYLVQRRVELPARLGGKTIRAAVALDDAEIQSAVWSFATALTPLLLVLGAFLALAAWVQVMIGLRPLTRVRQRLEAIGCGSERRLGSGFPDEIQPLANEIDLLLDARDKQIEQARARATDLAHGLKTPLQVLVGHAEYLRGRGESRIAGEIEEISTAMQRQVERHLARARMAAYDGSASTNVSEVVKQVVRVMERSPEGRQVAWSVSVPPELKARIDRDDLAEALGNLAENAARHARSHVTLSARVQAEVVIISFADDGPGIPMELQKEALRRGGRLDTGGPGAGLGLAIVTDIAETWGGTLWLHKPKSGFEVCLRIPIAGVP